MARVVTLAILVAAALDVLVLMAVPVGTAILLILVVLMVVLAPILVVVAAQVANVNLADPVAEVVLMSLVAKCCHQVLRLSRRPEVVQFAMARVFVGTLVLMILAAELVLIVQEASSGTSKLMVSDREDSSKIAPPIRWFCVVLMWVLMILVDIDT